MPVADADRLGVATQRFEPLAKTALRKMIEAEIRRGMRGGINPLVIARTIARKGGGITLTRAMTIARTEMAVAGWTNSQRDFYRDPVVTQWQWQSTSDGKTCPACSLLNGTTWPTNDRMRSHPNCRCTMVPIQKGDRLGSTGFARVGRMGARAQSALLGPSRAAFLQGGGDPTALITTRVHPFYGPTPVLTRVRDLPRP